MNRLEFKAIWIDEYQCLSNSTKRSKRNKAQAIETRFGTHVCHRKAIQYTKFNAVYMNNPPTN